MVKITIIVDNEDGKNPTTFTNLSAYIEKLEHAAGVRRAVNAKKKKAAEAAGTTTKKPKKTKNISIIPSS